MEKITVGITTEFITISNILKYAGVLETGGQAHEAIEAGVVTLNGVIVTEKRKKVFPPGYCCFRSASRNKSYNGIIYESKKNLCS